ncbi:MAG: hypothetical protein JXR03_13860 [Cyclobacteriaceae bacterium]
MKIDGFLYRISILLVIFILSGCKNRLEKKEKEGFQVFTDYDLAINVPCELRIDSTLVNLKEFNEVKSYVCPQIFKDSTRKSFDLPKLINNGNNVYHLKIWEKQNNPIIEESLEAQLKIIESFNINEIQEIEVDNTLALIYGPIKIYTWEAFIPLQNKSIYIAVSGLSAKSELKNILEDLVLKK